MMEFLQGNLFEADVEALVNTVNTVGVMGKGVALQFKERFPANFAAYAAACKNSKVRVGEMFITRTGRFQNPKVIVNFPTKEHWRGNSQISFISEGLDDLALKIKELGIKSIALPPLGCGNGGLDWAQVKPLIVQKLGSLDVEIKIFEPGLKVATSLTNAQPAPLTKARSMILRLLENYAQLGFDATHLEVQKLAYFLQSFGQQELRLQYKKGNYGPFAPNLQHLLRHLEGGWLAGDVRVADGKPFDALWLLPGKSDEIEQSIQRHCSVGERIRLEQVGSFIEGFQSPFGLELLSTVHWTVHQKEADATDFQSVVQSVHRWNERKKQLMSPLLLAPAYERVMEFAI